MQTLRPRYLLVGKRFHEGYELQIGDDCRIARVGPISNETSFATELPNEAIIPGLVNVHSHAFQRGLRGLTQVRSPSGRDTFWTWRESMFRLVSRLSPEAVYAVSAFCFLEMLFAGITTVGEFHYVHHDPKGKPYADPNELGWQVLRAAEDVGIRIVLLDAAYARGGFKKAASPAQKRFCDRSVEGYLQRVDQLIARLPAGVTAGLAPHSTRAVPQDWLEAIRDYNARKKLPLHMHVQEQPGEIAECKREYRGKTPTEVLNDLGLLSRNMTAVHATHTTARDKKLLAKGRVTVCACPTTEGDLGDGILEADDLVKKRIPLAFGTDSQIRLNPWEDARALENHLRLRIHERNVLSRQAAPVLWEALARNGARSLSLPAGELKVGNHADFVTLDLESPSLVGADCGTLLTQAVFSLELPAVKSVTVAGKTRLSSGAHPLREALQKQFRAALQGLREA